MYIAIAQLIKNDKKFHSIESHISRFGILSSKSIGILGRKERKGPGQGQRNPRQCDSLNKTKINAF